MVPNFFPLLLAVLLTAAASGAAEYYVAKSGHDNGQGTETDPWLTIQKAANTLKPGETVHIQAGTYRERVTINVQGSVQGGYVTFRNRGSDTVVLDGTGFNLSKPWGGLIQAFGKSYLRIQGLHIRNTKGGGGIVIVGDCGASHIDLLDNEVTAHDGGNGIGIRGSNLSYVLVDNNEVHHCNTGAQEAIRVDKGVAYFKITNNRVHDNTNIGIDCVGWGVQPAYGLISGNVCFRNGLKADGAHAIYVDGGIYITIENNVCYDNAGGISIGAEYKGETAHHIIARRNLLYHGWAKGITLGGSTAANGWSENCAIVHNTLYNNQMGKWPRELKINHFLGTMVVKNNIFYNTNIKSAGLVENRTSAHPENLLLDFNCYFPANAWRAFKNVVDNSLTTWQAATGQDGHSLAGDPLFQDAAKADFRLQAGSPCRDAGDFLARTVSAGNGLVIPVSDARAFCDGYGGWFPADLVQVGSQGPARITQVNYAANMIGVDRPLVWSAGDGVSQPYAGAKPDMGAYEFCAAGGAVPPAASQPKPSAP